MTELRTMLPADLPDVLAIERALFPESAWSEGMLRDELAGVPATRYYRVAVQPEIIGYAGLFAAGEQADVLTIAVLAAHQGRGIGRALLTDLIAESARRGAIHLFLEVREDNPRAQRLYRNAGFTEIGLRRGYYNGVNAITMRRDVTAHDREGTRA